MGIVMWLSSGQYDLSKKGLENLQKGETLQKQGYPLFSPSFLPSSFLELGYEVWSSGNHLGP